MNTEIIMSLVTIVVTFILGLIAKKISWVSDNLIPLQNLVIGIIVGLIGIVLVATNYPIFNKLLRSRKEKYSSQILLLLNKEE